MANIPPSIVAEGDRLFNEYKGAFVENYTVQQLQSGLDTPAGGQIRHQSTQQKHARIHGQKQTGYLLSLLTAESKKRWTDHEYPVVCNFTIPAVCPILTQSVLPLPGR